MSLRDKLRGLRGGDNDGGNDSDAVGSAAGDGASTANRISGGRYDDAPGSGLSSSAELTEFAPRQDGEYHCAERGLHLRFARPAVTESDTTEAEAARGEFTTSGRFSVQRRFGRPIVYTVLSNAMPRNARPGNAVPGDTAEYDVTLTVRRTNTETRAAERLEFTFEADEA